MSYTQQLRAELGRLLNKELDLVELSNYTRLTDVELMEYDAAQERMSELLNELSSLTPDA